MPQDNVALCRRWFKEVWNENNERTIEELMAPEAVIHGLGDDGQSGVGPDAFKKFFDLFRASLSSIHVVVHDVISQGDQTALRLTLTATHTGSGFGVPPSGRPVNLTAIVWARWRDGKMVEAWNEFDAAGLMKQISGGAADSSKLAVKA
jgi:predicted ester cyclase